MASRERTHHRPLPNNILCCAMLLTQAKLLTEGAQFYTSTRSTNPQGGGRLRGSWDANYPSPPPPPPLGAFGQKLVAKGVALRRPWAPKLPDAT